MQEGPRIKIVNWDPVGRGAIVIEYRSLGRHGNFLPTDQIVGSLWNNDEIIGSEPHIEFKDIGESCFRLGDS